MSAISSIVQMQSIWSLLGIIVIYQLIRRFAVAYKASLRNIPGPFWAKFSRWDRVCKVASGKSHEIDLALHKRYGPMVRNGPNRISVSDPKAISIIYGMNNKFVKVSESTTGQGQHISE